MKITIAAALAAATFAFAPLAQANEGEGEPFPFSAGPGFCPAKPLVEMLGSHMLAHLLRRNWTVPERRRLEQGRMPPTFDQFSLTLGLA